MTTFKVMKRSIFVLLHAGFWACYVMVILIMLGVYGQTSANGDNQTQGIANAFYNIALLAPVPSCISFYLFYFLLSPKYLHQRKVLISNNLRLINFYRSSLGRVYSNSILYRIRTYETR